MTKAVTSVAALRLVERGAIGLDDSDGIVGVLLTQVELGEETMPLLGEFQEVRPR